MVASHRKCSRAKIRAVGVICWFFMSCVVGRIPPSRTTWPPAPAEPPEGETWPPALDETCLPSRMSRRGCWGNRICPERRRRRREMERTWSGTGWRGEEEDGLDTDFCVCGGKFWSLSLFLLPLCSGITESSRRWTSTRPRVWTWMTRICRSCRLEPGPPPRRPWGGGTGSRASVDVWGEDCSTVSRER